MLRKTLWLIAILCAVSGLLSWAVNAAAAEGAIPQQAPADAHPLQATLPVTPTLTTQPTATATLTQAPPSATATQAPATATPSATQLAATNTATRQPSGPSATPEPFTLSKVEPDRIVQEIGGSISVYGSGFGPGTAVRLVDYGLLDSVVINSTAIRAVVPPGIPEGRYSVEVIRSDGSSLRDSNAVRIRSGEEEPTPTYTPGPPLVYGKPEILIQSAETDPEQVRNGGDFTLGLSLINRGDYTATNVQIAVNAEDLAVPRGATNLVVFDTMEPNEVQNVAFPLALSEEATNGFHSLTLSLSYSDYYGRSYDSVQNVGVNVSSSSSSQPLVLLTAYATEPESLSPGDAFVLRLEVTNVGQSGAGQVLVTLGGQDGSGTRPFAMLDAGNVKFIQSLEAGEAIELEQRIILDGAADSGVYNLPVTLEYETAEGVHESETQTLNLLVSRRPQVRIDYFEPPATVLVGEPVDLLIEVVNIGRNLVNISTMEVDGPDLDVILGTSFIGALDGGTSGSLDASVVPERSGDLPVIVTVNYLDDFNQPQQITQTLSLTVEEPAAPEAGEPTSSEQPGEEGGFWARVMRFLRGLFGLGS